MFHRTVAQPVNFSPFPGAGVPKSMVMIPSLVTLVTGADFLDLFYSFGYILDLLFEFFLRWDDI